MAGRQDVQTRTTPLSDLEDPEESVSVRTSELFNEATALGTGGHGMGRSCLLF